MTGVNIHEGAGPAQVCVTIDDLGGVTISSAMISTSDFGSGNNQALEAVDKGVLGGAIAAPKFLGGNGNSAMQMT